jgi:hypothetical protein
VTDAMVVNALTEHGREEVVVAVNNWDFGCLEFMAGVGSEIVT